MRRQYIHYFIGINLLLIVLNTVYADVKLPRLLSDGVILQRDKPLNIWGWADEGEHITLSVRHDNNIERYRGQTKDGRWEISVLPHPAGGPYEINIRGNNELSVKDVYFGDVWLASGQSNMEYPLSRLQHIYEKDISDANNALIRQFKVPKDADYKRPREDLSAGAWRHATSKNLPDYSAVAYFFAQNIYQKQGVPIGIINSSYGGSAAQSWMSKEALKAFPHYLKVANKLKDDRYINTLKEKDKHVSDSWYQALNDSDKGLNQSVKWFDPTYDFNAWPSLNVPSFWEDQGHEGLDGVLWFQREIHLQQSELGKPAILSLGRIVDADDVYVNGVKVGSTAYQYPQRRYTVPQNILQQGKNRITVRIINSSGKGGFIKDKAYYLATHSRKIDLTGSWRYKIGTQLEALAPPSVLWYKQPLGFYNAMLAPLLKFSIKGVIWYQGESNTENPHEYKNLFPAMIRDWRKQWGQGDFPFIYTQLANFKEAKDEPSESRWAQTRDAQTAALNEPNTAMAVAIDLGEWNDIHPINKKAVGQRLALATRKIAYQEEALVHSGPKIKSVEKIANKVTINFEHIGSGLLVKGEKLGGFAVADKNGAYVWANAIIRNGQVIVWHEDVSEIAYIRYAWADNPTQANLYNKEGLPAVPFSVTVSASQ